VKLHIITVGAPKLQYARLGFDEYISRLKHYHGVRITHVADKHNDAGHLLAAAGKAHKVALVIQSASAREFSSPELAQYIQQRNLAGSETAFIIGGPDGLPPEILQASNLLWSFGRLTYPHDLAMLILAEALYRASTIAAGQPYHR
jgi:23S rRNA (pseudouridine1915-N3)-methyltransferase